MLERIQISPFAPIDWDEKRWWGLCLQRTPRLKELNVEHAYELAIDDTSHLEKLVLRSGCDIAWADFSKIVVHANLVEVDFDYSDGDLASALEDLHNIPSLRRLVVRSSGLTWAGDPLSIGWLGITKRIGELKQLKELELESSGPVQFDDRCLLRIVHLQNLRLLTLNGGQVSNEAIKKIEDAIPGLHCKTASRRMPGVRAN